MNESKNQCFQKFGQIDKTVANMLEGRKQVKIISIKNKRDIITIDLKKGIAEFYAKKF